MCKEYKIRKRLDPRKMHFVVLIMVVIVFILNVRLQILLLDYENQYKQMINDFQTMRIDTYNEDQRDFFTKMREDFETIGFYNKENKYYCVWTEGLSFSQKNETEYHEACHHLIGENPIHFCSEYCSEGIEIIVTIEGEEEYVVVG